MYGNVKIVVFEIAFFNLLSRLRRTIAKISSQLPNVPQQGIVVQSPYQVFFS